METTLSLIKTRPKCSTFSDFKKNKKKNQSDFDTFQSLGQLLFSMAEKKKIKYVNSSPLHGKYMTDTYTTWSLELVVLVLCFPARSGETWLPSI